MKHTPGPWQVVIDEHPHHHGGKHVERRIFTTWDHPQLRAPDGIVNMSVGLGEAKGGPARCFVSISEPDARLIAAAPDLLQSLRDLVDVMTGRMNGETVALHNALAAIQKATGADAQKDQG